ncbi:MAG TPA: glycoside hydrolase family 27 protein [Candidatus Limiplasma sp.]|nr:glycoside hydrolase family 27 protein [Candidatus Limiplasma sp.]
MYTKTPPMGWNSWNTFGPQPTDSLVRETADAMVSLGYLDAGYDYVIIDDGWMLPDRDENGLFVADPEKFPYGIRALADYVHSKGLKFGIYSCAGTRTCARYPGSFDHDFSDARQFAQWHVDYLKYDFCNFPSTANCRQRYQTMSMALRACGRDIYFAACNWGLHSPELWMRSAGVNSYRSTGDIMDNFTSAATIAQSQLDLLHCSAAPCFNDMDMLTVGMFGKGHVGLNDSGESVDVARLEQEYVTQFALWACMGSALIIGADIRAMSPSMRSLLQNKELIAINQDEECRSPYMVSREGARFCFLKHLSDHTVALVYANLSDEQDEVDCIFADFGLPYTSGIKLKLHDILSGEEAGMFTDHCPLEIPAHGCRVFKASFVTA